MRVSPVSLGVFVFAEAHALADIDQHGDLRIVDDFARGAPLDAEEKHDQAGQCEAPQEHDAEAGAARQLDGVAPIELPDDGDQARWPPRR